MTSLSACLTGPECLAEYSGLGLLDETTLTCVNTCPVTTVLKQTTSQCITQATCWGQSLLVSPSTNLCEPSCTVTEYLDTTNKYCYTSPECIALGLIAETVSSSNVCHSLTPSSATSCPALQYSDTTSNSCVTKAQCNSFGRLVENIAKLCVSSCPSNLPYSYQGECVAICPAIIEESNNTCVDNCQESVTPDGKFCQKKVLASFATAGDINKDILIVKLSLKFSQSPTELIENIKEDLAITVVSLCLKMDESTSKFCQIVVQEAKYESKELTIKASYSKTPEIKYQKIEIELQNKMYFKANNYRSYFENQILEGKISRAKGSADADNGSMDYIKPTARGSAGLAAVSVAAAPLIMAGSIDLGLSSVLCLVAQTYSKLTLMTYMNFTLVENEVSLLYYNTFKEYFDQYNDVLVGLTMGTETPNQLADYICEAGFEKYCYVRSADNFYITKLLDFLIFLANLLLIAILFGLLTAFRSTTWKQAVKKNIKEVLFFSFLLDNNLSFIFNLLLTTAVPIYRDGFFSFFKVLAILTLLVYVAFYALLPWRKKLENKKWVNWLGVIFERVKGILKSFSKAEKSDEYTLIILVHDCLFACCLMTTKVAGIAQTIIWALVEVAFLALIIRRRFFINKALLIRQIVAESFFLLLSVSMIATHFENVNSRTLALVIMIGSMGLLWLDICFCVCYTIYEVIKFIRNKKRNRIQSKVDEKVSDFVPEPRLRQVGKLLLSNNLRDPNAKQIIRISELDKSKLMQRHHLQKLFELPSKKREQTDEAIDKNKKKEPSVKQIGTPVLPHRASLVSIRESSQGLLNRRKRPSLHSKF
jgi:hypothetical protein